MSATASSTRMGGPPCVGFNSSHWFVGHALGLAAYPREGGGSPTYYRSIDPSVEAFAVDDTAVCVCIENDIVRVSLADETHEALTHGAGHPAAGTRRLSRRSSRSRCTDFAAGDAICRPLTVHAAGHIVPLMFEAAELGNTLDKATYDAREPRLREELLDLQFQVLQATRFPVILVFGGLAGAGKGETVNTLLEWIDARFVEVHATGAATDEELERPPMWRFWRRLPPKGKFGIFFSSWYSDAFERHARKKSAEAEFLAALAEIRRFEKMLADEGALILKFWFHLSKQAQRHRLDQLWADKDTRYRVQKQDWKQHARYDDYRLATARALTETDRPHAPWLVVEGSDRRYRDWNTGEALVSALRRRLDAGTAPTEPVSLAVPSIERLPIVSTLDLTQKVEEEEYEGTLAKLQRRLAMLSRHRRFERLSPVLVFEGVDAAGKGGAIRRVTRALDARLYEIHAIAAPTDEEKRQPYLWRFWRHLPRDGKFAIFDRSWYGRVLVERVEGFATEADWLRAYGEINDFEEQLARAGNVVVKFWLQVSQDEQLRRFREREQTAFKQFKITPEDWRNREKWDAYARAASDMIERTSTERAPWTLVEAEDKLFARIKVLKTIVDAIERAEAHAR